MNPVAGGLLGQDSALLGSLAEQVGARTIPELAIRYLTSNPSVTTVISGIARKSDVDNTIAAVDRGPFTSPHMDRLRHALAEIHAANKGFCTGCRYCLPCSAEIDIPAIMNMISLYRFWGLQDSARGRYRDIKGPKADACVRCGKCEGKCTQHLHIMAEMDYAIRNLASG